MNHSITAKKIEKPRARVDKDTRGHAQRAPARPRHAWTCTARRPRLVRIIRGVRSVDFVQRADRGRARAACQQVEAAWFATRMDSGKPEAQLAVD